MKSAPRVGPVPSSNVTSRAWPPRMHRRGRDSREIGRSSAPPVTATRHRRVAPTRTLPHRVGEVVALAYRDRSRTERPRRCGHRCRARSARVAGRRRRAEPCGEWLVVDAAVFAADDQRDAPACERVDGSEGGQHVGRQAVVDELDTARRCRCESADSAGGRIRGPRRAVRRDRSPHPPRATRWQRGRSRR